MLPCMAWFCRHGTPLLCIIYDLRPRPLAVSQWPLWGDSCEALGGSCEALGGSYLHFQMHSSVSAFSSLVRWGASTCLVKAKNGRNSPYAFDMLLLLNSLWTDKLHPRPKLLHMIPSITYPKWVLSFMSSSSWRWPLLCILLIFHLNFVWVTRHASCTNQLLSIDTIQLDWVGWGFILISVYRGILVVRWVAVSGRALIL